MSIFRHDSPKAIQDLKESAVGLKQLACMSSDSFYIEGEKNLEDVLENYLTIERRAKRIADHLERIQTIRRGLK